MKKKCNKCQIEKLQTDFPKNSRYKSGYLNSCKVCTNRYNETKRQDKLEQYKAQARERYWSDPDKARAERKQYAKGKEQQKAEYDVKYREDNSEHIAKYKKQWESKNKDNPEFKIKRNLRRRLNHALKGNLKAEKTFDLLGCDVKTYITYLESKFEKNMSWDNYGQYGWHIDHIRPCFSFDLSDPEQQKECFHYTNTRPLWWRENLTRKRKDYEN